MFKIKHISNFSNSITVFSINVSSLLKDFNIIHSELIRILDFSPQERISLDMEGF